MPCGVSGPSKLPSGSQTCESLCHRNRGVRDKRKLGIQLIKIGTLAFERNICIQRR